MKKLIALLPILYLSKQYAPGDEIPASNQAMVEAWLENNAAIWEGKTESMETKEEDYEEDTETEEYEENNNEESFESDNSVAMSQQQEITTLIQELQSNEISTNEINKETEDGDAKPISRRNKK